MTALDSRDVTSRARGIGAQIQLFAASATSPVGWRLLSGNNREAGRGAVLYADAEAARIAVKEIQRDVMALEPRIRRVEPNRWLWELHADHRPVVVAGHAFDRLIRCEQAAAAFVLTLSDAPVAALVILSNARRWGTVAS